MPQVNLGKVVGPQGPQGPTGPTGPGVPNGGATGTFLRKKSSANQDTEWKEPTAAEITYSEETTYATGTVGRAVGDLQQLTGDIGLSVVNGKLCVTYND